jgi:hypothetical protein
MINEKDPVPPAKIVFRLGEGRACPFIFLLDKMESKRRSFT